MKSHAETKLPLDEKNIFKRLKKTGVPFTKVTQFLRDGDLSALAVNKEYLNQTNQDPRWKQRLHKELSKTLHTKIALASVKNSILHPPLDEQQEKQIVDHVFYNLNKRNIVDYQSIFARYNKVNRWFDPEYLYPEHLVLLSGNVKVVKEYLEKNKVRMLNADIKDKWYYSTIKAVALLGNSELIRYLHAMGCNFNVENDQGYRFQHWVALSGNVEALRTCRELKFDMEIKTNRLVGVQHMASRSGNCDAIKWCQKFGLDMYADDIDGLTVPYYAALSGNGDAILTCKDLDLDMRKKSKLGLGVQHAAGISSKRDALLACQRIGFDMKAIDAEGLGVQHYTAEGGNVAALMTCANELNLNMKDSKNLNKMGVQHYAFKSGKRDVMMACKEMGLDLTEQTKDGSYPQHYAALSGKREAILTCVELGLDMTVFNKDLQGIQYAAAEGGRESMLAVHELDMDMELEDKDDMSVQFLAALKGKVDSLIACAELGLDFHKQNIHNHSIAIAAMRSGNIDAIQYIMDLQLDFKTPSTSGMFPQHTAAMSGSADALQLCNDAKLDMKRILAGPQKSIQHIVATLGDKHSVIKCEEIGLNLKLPTQGKTMLHFSASASNLETMIVAWAAGLDMYARDLMNASVMDYAFESKNEHFVSVARLLSEYNCDYHFKQKYYQIWQSAAYAGITEQVIRLLLDYADNKVLGFFKPRHYSHVYLIAGSLMSIEKNATAESVFFYLLNQFIESTRCGRLKSDDGFTRRFMFILKMLYPLVILERTLKKQQVKIDKEVKEPVVTHVVQAEIKSHLPNPIPAELVLGYLGSDQHEAEVMARFKLS